MLEPLQSTSSSGSSIAFALSRVGLGALRALIFLLPPILLGVTFAEIVSRLHKRALPDLEAARARGYLLGFAVFGLSLGLFAGFANTPSKPVFDTLLPPFLALFTASVTYLTKKETPAELRVLVPGSVIVLLGCFLFSFFYVRFY